MLIHSDVKGLEVCCAAFLSQDSVLYKELWDNYQNPTQDDLHTANQKTFQLPDRVTAKRFTFKMLYGGSDYGFSIDPKFNHISRSKKYWADVIAKFYTKYYGVNAWHNKLLPYVLEHGYLESPTGRRFLFDKKDVINNTGFWLPKLKNYIVQGLGADLVAIARVTMHRRLTKEGIKALFISTVHDSIDIDIPNAWGVGGLLLPQGKLDKSDNPCYNIYEACKIVEQSIRDVPINFERVFGIPFDLPLNCETSFGLTLKNTTLYQGQTE